MGKCWLAVRACLLRSIHIACSRDLWTVDARVVTVLRPVLAGQSPATTHFSTRARPGYHELCTGCKMMSGQRAPQHPYRGLLIAVSCSRKRVDLCRRTMDTTTPIFA